VADLNILLCSLAGRPRNGSRNLFWVEPVFG
jgi:hypothetical protein